MVYKKYSATRFSRKRIRPRPGYKRRRETLEDNYGEKNDLAGDIMIPKGNETLNSNIEYEYNSLKNLGTTQYDSQKDSLDICYEDGDSLKNIDTTMGFERVLGAYEYGRDRLGWLVNMHPTTVLDPTDASIKYSAVDLYFLDNDGSSFKATHIYNPYFYLMCHDRRDALDIVETYLVKTYKPYLSSIDRKFKEDLLMVSVQDLLLVRRNLLQSVNKNDKVYKLCRMRRVESMIFQLNSTDDDLEKAIQQDPTLLIKELREYDIPYYMRVCIDLDIRVACWYKVSYKNNNLSLLTQTHIIDRPKPVVLAFDIETTKQPLKFPESSIDSIMMISYMIDEMGFLITNRDIVSEDIKPFEYAPKPEYEGHFTIYNEPNEKSLLSRFFKHIRAAKPKVVITYNGDFFDWPFVEDRAQFHGFDLKKEIGFYKNSSKEYLSSYACHIDCLYWVKRDSYLPQGSHGLKTVVKAKVGYNPVEIDPEDMTRFAIENPQILSQYSVSDALSTYYLYMKHIHPFIFSLCNIIPMNPDDVLRKGSGTLCESLLMVEAYRAGVLIPNKHAGNEEKFFEGHLIESETYVGGHVEALEAGIFRQDLPVQFNLSQKRIQELLENIDNMLNFSIITECNIKKEDVLNYEEIKASIKDSLLKFLECPSFAECPSIYHFDVGAMYPNIILTNRLQPYSIVNDQFCNACDFFNGPETKCRRNIKWLHRSDYYSPEANEYKMILNQLKTESFFDEDGKLTLFDELRNDVKVAKIKERLITYSKKVYNKIRNSKIVEEESVVCQRENSFYINTVRNFRDKRYYYKEQLKKIKEAHFKEADVIRAKELQSLMVIYDSLQLAHKCILNSFYGYVMRKGARWYSIEMAGIVCLIGAKIIQMARSVIDDIGKPLELDTDGIWCILPNSFPGKFTLDVKNSKSLNIFYPCVILNKKIHENFTNHVYMDLCDAKSNKYTVRSENSIFFEVDGPYRAMILPSSSKEDKMIKKRYAVFNKDGSLAEIKGFEVKRRGELKLIKLFQSQIFNVFLEGSTIEECYRAVSSVANQWLDVLYSKGACLEDNELFDLISENRNMSRSIEQYGTQKSASISTARRLAELLGDQMVMKHKGLTCKYVICNRPLNSPVSSRAIPCAVFQAQPEVREHYLRRWLGIDSGPVSDIRDFLDWKYYLERFGSVVQKIIIVPASLQKIQNFVPRIPYPDWLQLKLKTIEMQSNKDKKDLVSAFASMNKKKLLASDLQTSKMGENIDNVGDKCEDLFKNNVINQYSNTAKYTEIQNGPPSNEISYNPMIYKCYRDWITDIKRKWLLILKLRANGELNEIDKVKYARPSSTNIEKNVIRGGVGLSGNKLTNKLLNQTLPFQDRKKILLNNVWHILQIRLTDVPGVLLMWIIVDNCLHEVKLNVKRVIYINSITDDIESSGLKDGIVIKKEPHYRLLSGSQVYNLYSLQMPEAFYKQNLKMFSAICNHPNIENIYCENISLQNYAIIKLGSVVKLRPNLSYLHDSILNVGPDIEDLENQTNSSDFTCRPSSGLLHNIKFEFIYLFYVELTCGTYACICNSKTNTMKLVIYNRHAAKTSMSYNSNKSEDAKYEEIYNNMVNLDAFSENNYIKYSNRIIVNAHHTYSEEHLHEEVNSLYKREVQSCNNGYIMLLAQNPHEMFQMLPKMFPFVKKHPLMYIPLHNEYKKYQFLDWQKNITKYMFTKYLELNRFIQSRADLSVLFDIPVLNIPHDYPLYLTDVTFARRMIQAGIILDWSENGHGKNKSISQNYSLYTCDFKYPEVNMKGCYNTLCFELNVQDFILAPLLSNTPNFSEIKSHLPSHSSVTVSTKNYTSCQKNGEILNDTHVLYHKNSIKNTDVLVIALDIFKSIVMNWTTGVRKKNIYYAIMLSNIYRWFTSKNSAMSTPPLYHKIFIEMRSYFMSLITDIEHLGGRTVYASFDKLVIAMQNSTFDLCISSSKQIITSIQNNPMFSPVTFSLNRAWKCLIWLDPQNYGGINAEISNDAIKTEKCAEHTEEMANVSDMRAASFHPDFQSETDLPPNMQTSSNTSTMKVPSPNKNVSGASPVEINMFWCISYVLQVKYREILLQAIAGYIYNAFHSNENNRHRHKDDEGVAQSMEITTSMKGDIFVSSESYVNNVLKLNLIKLLSKIIDDNDSYDKYTHKRTPEPNYVMKRDDYLRQCATMINYLCEILGLDQNIKQDMDHLKADLFSMLEISEFSSTGEFSNPFERIRIHNHFCLFCSEVKPLDIIVNCTPKSFPLTDSDNNDTLERTKIITDTGEEIPICIVNEQPILNGKFMWYCTSCGYEHDTMIVEWELIETIKHDLLAWHLQDPICKRCKVTKIEDLRLNCHSCSGEVLNSLNGTSYDRRFRAIYNLSHSINKFPILKEASTCLTQYMTQM